MSETTLTPAARDWLMLWTLKDQPINIPLRQLLIIPEEAFDRWNIFTADTPDGRLVSIQSLHNVKGGKTKYAITTHHDDVPGPAPSQPTPLVRYDRVEEAAAALHKVLKEAGML